MTDFRMREAYQAAASRMHRTVRYGYGLAMWQAKEDNQPISEALAREQGMQLALSDLTLAIAMMDDQDWSVEKVFAWLPERELPNWVTTEMRMPEPDANKIDALTETSQEYFEKIVAKNTPREL